MNQETVSLHSKSYNID